ncbi:PREDICTED: uncharacterized protein LOC105557016 [Vollenhovia emeryi]|uniref:uncharacterized protein LOC105557016 n=1 Tax=Vollenhovia emeryi TaxID=411798 RepID=UPI0005F43CC4|nr:PREDICTED: uncharacterized protein LOC105557016 [Vollenhovia emeryi]
MMEKKTGKNISDEINDVLQAFGLQGKQITAVTDAGSNVVLACKLLKMKHHKCLGHGVHNLITADGLKRTDRLEEIVKKAKKIVKTVRYRAPELEAEFDKQQRQLLTDIMESADVLDMEDGDPLTVLEDIVLEGDDEEVPAHAGSAATACKKAPTLKTDVVTRWHALLRLCKSMGPHRNSINIILARIEKSNLMLTSSEWEFLNDLGKFLESFHTAVEVLSAEKSATLNVALLMRAELEERLEDSESDSLLILQMKNSMRAQLDHRFPVTDLLVVAALLDPRCQNLKSVKNHLSDRFMTKAEFLVAQVKENVREADVIKEDITVPVTEPSSKVSAQPVSPVALLAQKHSAQVSSSDRINEEGQFPWLSALARGILCIPATSTPSERVFSIAGLVVTAKRSCLHPLRVHKIIFVHNNYNVCKQIVNGSS